MNDEKKTCLWCGTELEQVENPTEWVCPNPDCEL